MASAQFKPDFKSFGKLLNSEKMKKLMEVRAEMVVAVARPISPVDSGTYAASFDVTSGLNGGLKGDRAWAKARNTSDHSAAVEFGNRRTPHAQRVLGRAAAAVSGSD